MYSGLISIIIPCYRSEAFIARIIECVIAQTYNNWELLLISNGQGQEAQRKVIESFEHRDGRIKCVSVEQSGASNARNIGIDLVNGEFFTFLDADDTIVPDHLQRFVEVIDEESQLIIGGYTLLRSKEGVQDAKPLYSFDSSLSPNGMIDGWQKYIEMEDSRASASWNKLHRTEFIRSLGTKFDITFTSYEDTDFYLSIMPYVTRLQCIPMSGYCYICADESSLQSKYHSGLAEIFDSLSRKRAALKRLIGNTDEEIEEFQIRQQYMNVYWLICNLFKKECPLSFSQKQKEIAEWVGSDTFRASVSMQDRSQHNRLLKMYDFAIASHSSLFIAVFFAVQYRLKTLLGPFAGSAMRLLRH